MQKKITISNIIAYCQGNIRYKLWYSPFKFLIRKHIVEQINFRVKFMETECYTNGNCKLCGCTTIELQMANKECDMPCYPEMMNKKEWHDFITEHTYLRSNGYIDSKGRKWVYRENYITVCEKGSSLARFIQASTKTI